ncbi:MAG: hypothetical protein GXP50_05455 [Deltaproteobacteria bacterium]|nr:hypothetical protein [Deltaproteobacteria bacterium]
MRGWRRLAAAAAGLLSLVGCGAVTDDGTARVVVSLRARGAPRAAGAIAGLPAGITRITVACTAQGMSPVSAEVPLDGTPVVLTVPAGPDRTFTAEVFAGEVLRMRGTTVVEYLYAGSRVSVRIPLQDLASVTVNPSAPTVEAGGSAAFTAEVEALPDSTVTWTLEDVDCGAETGSVSADGIYTPGNPSEECQVRVVATSTADPSVRGETVVTVQPSGAAPVQVSVTPAQTTVQAGSSQAFTATVTGATDTAVTWSVEDVDCGEEAGTISADGAYTAGHPAAGCQVKVVAVSAADETARGEALVTVEAATVTLAISPQAPRVLTGGQLQLTATVAGLGSQEVLWSVDGIQGGNAEVGTITPEGLYTAPGSARTVTITATSAVVSWASGSVTVAVVDSSQAGLTAIYDDGTVKQEGPVFHGWWKDCGSTDNNLYQGECTPPSESPVNWAWDTDFAVNWSGYLHAPTSGTYTLGSYHWVDGRVYVKVGDTVIADLDTDGGGFSGTVELAAGQAAPVTLRFEPNGGSNNMQLWWKPPGGEWEPVPRAYLAPTDVVSVVLVPDKANVQAGGTVSFTATVVGDPDPSVDWGLADADGDCGGEIGSVSADGTYTAGNPTEDCDVEVRATSRADGSAWAEAVVTVDASAAIAIEPNFAVVLQGTSRQFSATVQGGGSSTIEWALGQGDPGTVDSTGLYTAPDSVRWDGDRANLTVSLATDPSVSATAQIVLFDGLFDTNNFPSVSNPDLCSDNDARDPVGMAGDGVSNLWVLDDDGTVFRVDVNGNVQECFQQSGLSGIPTGLAYDPDTAGGPYLWVGTSAGMLYRLTTTGQQVEALDLTPQGVQRADGLAWDGSHVWVSDVGQDKIFRIDPQTGQVTRALDYATYDPSFSGIGWDPTSGKVAAATDFEVFLLDPDTGEWTAAASLGANDGDGLAVLGPYVFGADRSDEEVEAAALERGGLPVSMRLIPGVTSVTLSPGGQQAFSATVWNALDRSVTWEVTDPDGDCGNEIGSVSTDGTYTAGDPALDCDVELTATSNADPTVSKSVTIQIDVPVKVSLTPDAAARPGGTEQVFTVEVTGALDTSVTWSLADADGDCGGEIGSVSADGMYTAGNPALACDVELTATSNADPTAQAVAPIAVSPPTPGFGFRALSPGYAAWAVWGTGPDDIYLVGGWGLATYEWPTAVLHSTDRGITWAVQEIDGHAMDVWGAGQTLYVAVNGGQIEKTTDGGATWARFPVSLTNPQLECVWTPDGTTVFVGGRYNSYSWYYPAVIARSIDGGQTWEVVYQGSTSTRIYDLWGTGAAVYAIEAGGGTWRVLKSSDGGDTWQDVSPAGRDACVEASTFHVVGSDAGEVYASGCWQVFRTTDGGATWTDVSAEEYAYGLAVTESGVLYLAGGSDVFVSTDSGQTWSGLGMNLTPRHVLPGTGGELAVVGFESGLTRSALWIYPDYDTDYDGDGLSDLRETGTGVYRSYAATGTNSYRADTDADGVPDLTETMAGTAADDAAQPAYSVTRSSGFPVDETAPVVASLSSCDGCTVTLDLPWTFPFFGTGYDRITVDDNGNIWLGDRASPPAPGFDLESIGPVIAVENGDFSTANTGEVRIHQETSDAYVAVWWVDVETKAQEGADSDFNTFGAYLYPDGTLTLTYRRLDGTGIEDRGSGLSEGAGNFLSITRALGPVYGLLQNTKGYPMFRFTPR